MKNLLAFIIAFVLLNLFVYAQPLREPLIQKEASKIAQEFFKKGKVDRISNNARPLKMSSDVNHDGIVDLGDIIMIDIDNLYNVWCPGIAPCGIITDLNEDGCVDVSDIYICDRNDYGRINLPFPIYTVNKVNNQLRKLNKPQDVILPTYTMMLANDVQVSDTEYEFDIYLRSTGTTPLQLYGVQMSFLYNTEILNGGALKAKWVPNSIDESIQSYGQQNAFLNTTIPGHIMIKANIMCAGWATPGVFIKDIGLGSRVGRLRLTNSSPFAHFSFDINFCPSILDYPNRIAAQIFNEEIYRLLPYDITNQNNHINNLKNPVLNPRLTMKALIEGRFNGTSMVSDTVSVLLRNTSYPYTLVDSVKGVMNTAGVGTFTFPTVVDSIPYYIVVKHRNSIETWSASPQIFTASALSYDFSTAATQAYGGNMTQKGSKWCIYSGDVVKDATYIIDASDMTAVDNDNTYSNNNPVTDLNADDIVDSSDLTIVDNNNTYAISRIAPVGAPMAKRVMRPGITQKQNIK